MSLLAGVKTLLGAGGALSGVLDKVIPDVNARREASQEFEKILIQFAENADERQAEINLKQAEHDSLFVAGARPALMWGCGIIFMYNTGIVPFSQNMMEIFFPLMGIDVVTLSRLDSEEVMPMLYGLLGLGGYRMAEKIKGVSRESMRLKRGMFSRFRK